MMLVLADLPQELSLLHVYQSQFPLFFYQRILNLFVVYLIMKLGI